MGPYWDLGLGLEIRGFAISDSAHYEPGSPGFRRAAPSGLSCPSLIPPDHSGSQHEFAVQADEWFHVAPYEPGLHLVAEPGHVFSWLIAGSERTVLLDTGLGIADVAAAVAPAATSPVVVVNSHVHFDHVGGNALFADTEMHELGPEWVAAGCRAEYLRDYRKLAAGMRVSWERLREADRDGWFMLGPDETVRPWPEARLQELGWRISPPEPTRLLREGEEIDLGDRVLRVIHTPGHAPDHICLVDERAGILFAQDQAYYGPHLICERGSDLGEFARSTRRLASELRGAIRVVYAAHCLRPALPPRFLDELADAAEGVAAGEIALSPAKGMFGEPVQGADFGHFSILVSDEARA